MRTNLSIAIYAVLLAACGAAQTPEAAQPPGPAVSSTATSSAAPASTAHSDPARAPDSAAAVADNRGGRELVSPDNSTMVLLYYDLARIAPPIDNWVEEDSRVKFAPAPDKASKRDAVRAELQSAAAAVHGIGRLRLTMNANLSDYDPTYGEFSVRALAPSSVVYFDALGEKVSVTFANGRTAQIWRVAQTESQAIRDKVSSTGSNIELDVLLKIDNVLPGPGGGTIVTEVLEFEMRGAHNGLTIGRVKVSAT